MNNKRLKAAQVFSVLVMVMGVIHIAATFTPVMAAKFAALGESALRAHTYFSLMCGGFLLVAGALTSMLLGKAAEHPFLRVPLMLLVASLALAGLLAVVYMPHNPFAWAIFAFTALLATASCH